MNESVPIYCFSGLGADSRIFQHLRLPGMEVRYIQWQMPDPTDTMRSFAAKLASQITEPEVALLGISFGGMLAATINALSRAQLLPFRVSQTILVSSCKSPAELPPLFRYAGKAGLHRILPYQWATKYSLVNRLIFDTRSKAEERYLKSVMLRSTDFTFLKRSVHMILTWKQEEMPQGIYHIHGKSDRLLPAKFVKADAWISGGGHFIIWNEATEVGRLIQQHISLR